MVRFLFDISKDFYPRCLACLLRKLTNPCACFEVLSAVFRYRPLDVPMPLFGDVELCCCLWFGVPVDFRFRDVYFASQSKGEVETLDTIA